MSNALRKKSKKMQPKGFSKNTLTAMRDNARKVSNIEAIIEDSFQNTKLISYMILHDKYGFGHTRLLRVENIINNYLNTIADQKLTINHLDYYIYEKCRIEVKKEVNKIPFNESFSLTAKNIEASAKKLANMYIMAATYDFFVLIGTCLKSQFKFSTKQILEVYEWIRYYINTLSRFKQLDLKIEDIALCLAEECKYLDERFAKEKEIHDE